LPLFRATSAAVDPSFAACESRIGANTQKELRDLQRLCVHPPAARTAAWFATRTFARRGSGGHDFAQPVDVADEREVPDITAMPP